MIQILDKESKKLPEKYDYGEHPQLDKDHLQLYS